MSDILICDDFFDDFSDDHGVRLTKSLLPVASTFLSPLFTTVKYNK